jgi:hypothetical protein
VQAALQVPLPQTSGAMHSSSVRQFSQLCSALQAPLAQLEPSALQPGAHALASVQY